MAPLTKSTILFLGATGGCTLTALVHALNDGFRCTALVRTPNKLNTLLENAGVSSSKIEQFLTIWTGNSTDVSILKEVLLSGSTDHQELPGIIISGLGGAPKLQFSLPPVTIDQPHICEDSAAALVAALSETYTQHPSTQFSKPLLCYVSTGGMYRGQDDVPTLIRMLYSYVLNVPWQDKKAMEKVFLGEMGRETFRTLVTVKATMLTDGPELGGDAMKVGTRTHLAPGYSISRKDIGGWIYRNVLLGGGEGWDGELVSLSYR